MSSEVQRAMNSKRGRVPGSPWMLPGFALGLLAMSPGAVLYYWLFAPLAALMLGGLLTLLSAWKPRLLPVAEGALAAALFGTVAVLTMFFAMGTHLG